MIYFRFMAGRNRIERSPVSAMARCSRPFCLQGATPQNLCWLRLVQLPGKGMTPRTSTHSITYHRCLSISLIGSGVLESNQGPGAYETPEIPLLQPATFGAPRRIQTSDPLLRTQLLYSLSYGRIILACPAGIEPTFTV